MKPRKVAIITGAGSGIGAATAELLSNNGYDVVINYSKSKDNAILTQKCCQDAGADALLIQGDIRNDLSCKAIVESTVARWGRIDALVNNAGISVFTGIDDWDSLDINTFRNIYEVNAIAAFQMVRACLPHLKLFSGSIVNVSSAGGVLGRGSSVPYIMSKGALNSLTLYLARTLAPRIRVNAVCPGLVTSRWFRDGLGEDGYKKIKEKYEKQTPLGIPNSPHDVAKAIFWLIEDAKTITGELLLLDSGLHLS